MMLRHRSRGLTQRTTLALGVFAIACLGLGFFLRSNGDGPTVREVHADIVELALRRATNEDSRDGGLVGPWRLAARATDRLSGDLIDVTFESETLLVNADRSRIAIDPAANTIAFELDEVNVIYIGTDDSAERVLRHRASYTIGPLPYALNIRDDGAGVAPAQASPRDLTIPIIADDAAAPSSR